MRLYSREFKSVECVDDGFQFSLFDSGREIEMGKRIPTSTLMKVMSFFFFLTVATYERKEKKRKTKPTESSLYLLLFFLRIFQYR